MPVMGRPSWRSAAPWILAAPIAIAVLMIALQVFIRIEARTAGDRAAAQFGGDRVSGLIGLVDCGGCSLRDRDRAVWALGELRDERALPVLKTHYTGGKCDHTAALCQYELGKAIMKIEGTWNPRSANLFRRSRP